MEWQCLSIVFCSFAVSWITLILSEYICIMSVFSYLLRAVFLSSMCQYKTGFFELLEKIPSLPGKLLEPLPFVGSEHGDFQDNICNICNNLEGLNGQLTQTRNLLDGDLGLT